MTALAGKRILITRARAQVGGLGRKLAGLGAQPIYLPTIEIAPLDDYDALDRAIRCLDKYHWLVFTSANGVEHFWQRLAISGNRQLPRLKVAAIGPATSQALESRGVQPTFVPEVFVSEAVAAGLAEVAGRWMLLPRAESAREALADELGQRGAFVHEVPAYRTLLAAPEPAAIGELRRGVDAITFTSASTVRNFVALAGDELPALRDSAAIACIGPITAQAAHAAGLWVDVVAATSTLDGLVAALAQYFAHSVPELEEHS